MQARVLLTAIALGCHREPAPAPTLEIADPAAIPAGAERIACRVGPKQSMVALDDAGLHLRFVTARGNTVSMMGRDVAAGDADVVLAGAIASFADGRAGEPWTDVQAKVTAPDGQSASIKVSFHVGKTMLKLLDGVRSGAVLFPGEVVAPSANKVAWVHAAGSAPYVLGEGRWRDVDLVELFDRRAGRHADATMIEGPELCANERDGAPSSNDAAVRAWVGSKLAR